ncbi:MAG: minor capsid protein [Clostridium sp.]|uniref:minor capsid protein n=1 Tax=Clostridium sp. TaxID=1506 RepID=UPI0029047AD3|nr:minor capsid protein [Clostridium sp.]MDU2680462.1 minor capsid protein [Clostridium sp.]
MKSRSNAYWKRRSNLRMESYHKNSYETIHRINNAYDKAIKDVNEDINKVFYKYLVDSDLSVTEARQLLNSKISKKELDSIRARIYGIQDKELKKYMMAQLNANAYKARITRLEALKESIYINTKLAADVEIKQSTKLYTDNIKKAYYTNLFDIQKGLGIGFNIAEMPLENIQEILKNNWSGKHYSKRIWNNTDVLAQKLEEIITSGLMSGKSSRRMALELQDQTDYGKFAAERLIRTETTYIANMAELESYKEASIEKVIFIATLDLRTSKICRSMDGKVIKVDKLISGGNLPPLHPYCRSTTRAYLKNMERLQRRARDPETGKTYIVPGDMTYQDWHDKFVVDRYGKDKTEVFEKMIKNKASDRKQLNRFKEVLGKESPKTLKDFQDLKYNSNEWKLVKDYVKSRENNMISVFTPYSQYKEYKGIIDSCIVGLTTNNGIKITGQSKHFIERVFGTNSDPKTNRPRSGVEISDIKDALLNGSVRIRKSDPNSIKFITDKCMVSINPKTGVLIQTNP